MRHVLLSRNGFIWTPFTSNLTSFTIDCPNEPDLSKMYPTSKSRRIENSTWCAISPYFCTCHQFPWTHQLIEGQERCIPIGHASLTVLFNVMVVVVPRSYHKLWPRLRAQLSRASDVPLAFPSMTMVAFLVRWAGPAATFTDLSPTLWLWVVKAAPVEVNAAADARREAKQSNFILIFSERNRLCYCRGGTPPWAMEMNREGCLFVRCVDFVRRPPCQTFPIW